MKLSLLHQGLQIAYFSFTKNAFCRKTAIFLHLLEVNNLVPIVLHKKYLTNHIILG